MIFYTIKRLALLPILLFLLSALVFSLVMFLGPYERLAVYIPEASTTNINVPLDELITRYGLDRPFYVQYFEWLKGIFSGNLGWSPTARMPVGRAIRTYFPATVELMVLGGVIIFAGGIFLGTYSAPRHNQLPDQIIRVLTIFGVSIPSFIFGLLLLVFFYTLNGLFPPGRLSSWATDVVTSSSFVRFTGMNLVDSIINGRFDVFLNSIRHLVLPALAYSIPMLSTILRVMRSSLLEVLNQEYITTARAKGLKENIVIKKHGRRNALLPVITLGGVIVARMVGGAVIVGTVFNYHGMGFFIATARKSIDFPAILGSTLLVGIIIIVVNLIIDLLYTVLDPTVELE